MTTIEVSLNAASLYYQQAVQVFTTCYVQFTEKRIRAYHGDKADKYMAYLNAKYAKRHQFTPEQGSAGWDLAFVLFLWQSDGDLRPKFNEDEVDSADDKGNSGYLPSIFGISYELNKTSVASLLNGIRLPAFIKIRNHQVWVVDGNMFFQIRNTRNNWAHGKVHSIREYAIAVRYMHTMVRALPAGAVKSDQLNTLAYAQGVLQHMVDLDTQAQAKQAEMMAQTAQLQKQIADANAEITTLRSQLAQSNETTQQQQTVQSEQQILVQALLTHMTNNTYDTHTTIDSLQDQIQDIKAQDRDDMLLATIVQLQQMVVQQRATISVLEQQMTAVAQGMSSLTRTKPIDPNTVPTTVCVPPEEQPVSQPTDTHPDADDTQLPDSGADDTQSTNPVVTVTPSTAVPRRHPWQVLAFVLLTTIAMVVLWMVQSGQWVIPAQWLHIWPF